MDQSLGMESRIGPGLTAQLRESMASPGYFLPGTAPCYECTLGEVDWQIFRSECPATC